jgi:hypothetical protein
MTTSWQNVARTAAATIVPDLLFSTLLRPTCGSQAPTMATSDLRSTSPPPAIFFGGCSWGCIYHIGVYSGFVQRFGLDNLKQCLWGGASSGALAALVGALSWTPEQARALYDTLADLALRYGVFGKMSIYHALVLEQMLPDGGSEYRALRGRLHVGVTRAPWKNDVISDGWSSNRELKDVMHASMHIPFASASHRCRRRLRLLLHLHLHPSQVLHESHRAPA